MDGLVGGDFCKAQWTRMHPTTHRLRIISQSMGCSKFFVTIVCRGSLVDHYCPNIVFLKKLLLSAKSIKFNACLQETYQQKISAFYLPLKGLHSLLYQKRRKKKICQ